MILQFIRFIIRSLLNVLLLIPRLLLMITVMPNQELWPGARPKQPVPKQPAQQAAPQQAAPRPKRPGFLGRVVRFGVGIAVVIAAVMFALRQFGSNSERSLLSDAYNLMSDAWTPAVDPDANLPSEVVTVDDDPQPSNSATSPTIPASTTTTTTPSSTTTTPPSTTTARTWTGATGQTAIATLLEVEGNQVRLQKLDRKIVIFPIDKLSAADQAYLRNQAQSQPPASLELSEVFTINADRSGVQSVAFSPDGKQIASGGWENVLYLWDARSGEQNLAIDLDGHGDLILDVKFSPDGRRILTGSRQDESNRTPTVKVWDARTGAEALVLENAPSQMCDDVAFSPDGSRIAVGYFNQENADRTLQLWDARTGAEVLKIKDMNGPVAFSPDGKQVTGGHGYDQNLKLWDTVSGEELLAIEGYTFKGFNSVAFSPDGRRIVSGNGDGTVRLWDARTGKELLTLSGYTIPVIDVAYSPDGRHIASGSAQIFFLDQQDPPDGRRIAQGLRLWGVGTGRSLAVDAADGVEAVAFSPDASRVVIGTSRGTLKLFSLSAAR